jgi:hypothetical protein
VPRLLGDYWVQQRPKTGLDPTALGTVAPRVSPRGLTGGLAGGPGVEVVDLREDAGAGTYSTLVDRPARLACGTEIAAKRGGVAFRLSVARRPTWTC